MSHVWTEKSHCRSDSQQPEVPEQCFKKLVGVSVLFLSHASNLVSWRLCFPELTVRPVSGEAFLMETKWEASTCILEPHYTASVTPNMNKQASPPFLPPPRPPVVEHQGRSLKVKFRLSSFYFWSHTSCKNMAESTDLSRRCVLEVASKNDFKTFRNCQAPRKCLLKTHKLVEVEENTSSKLSCVL